MYLGLARTLILIAIPFLTAYLSTPQKEVQSNQPGCSKNAHRITRVPPHIAHNHTANLPSVGAGPYHAVLSYIPLFIPSHPGLQLRFILLKDMISSFLQCAFDAAISGTKIRSSAAINWVADHDALHYASLCLLPP